ATAAAQAAYDRGETDEFIVATTVGGEARIRPGDAVLTFNFRPDRMRELTRALAEPGFAEVDRGGAGVVERYATLTEYEEGWPFGVVFPPHRPAMTIARVIAERGLGQLHVAETEKYPHVTYFFSGGKEHPEEGERRELVPSPRDVPTYDQKPAMSAPDASAAFERAWHEEDFLFAIINFANPDMVGHTGNLAAAVQAAEAVDVAIGAISAAVREAGGALLVTADHGNLEMMRDPDSGQPHTAHTIGPVPLVLLDGRAGAAHGEQAATLRSGGALRDVAPTVLDLLGLPQPTEMSGKSLLAGSGSPG
ncbi:MAG: 2,3-bisphosphoglycerate-independent phosphoglycerate mutase, partial [Proteobacteria bacterium]|nr:2,3-bisphosphoglycerate-independent phosphoglycerate mutase [Pseudomonadota bacterium]